MGSKHKHKLKQVHKTPARPPAPSVGALKDEESDVKTDPESQFKDTFEEKLKLAMEVHFKSVKAFHHARLELLDEEKPTPEFKLIEEECDKQWDVVLELTECFTLVDQSLVDSILKVYPSWYRRGVTKRSHIANMAYFLTHMFI